MPKTEDVKLGQSIGRSSDVVPVMYHHQLSAGPRNAARGRRVKQAILSNVFTTFAVLGFVYFIHRATYSVCEVS